MEPMLASADGHLAVLLLCVCVEIKADHKHKGVDVSSR